MNVVCTGEVGLNSLIYRQCFQIFVCKMYILILYFCQPFGATDQAPPGKGPPVSGAALPDHSRPPGGGGGRHQQLLLTPQQPRLQRSTAAALSDAEPTSHGLAPPCPWACEDVPPASPFRPLLTHRPPSCPGPNHLSSLGEGVHCNMCREWII